MKIFQAGGAKIVTSFTDEDIETIVHTGGYTDPRAERYVADVLKARRDKIGRYYFNLLNPLDRFALQPTKSDVQALVFENLALTGGSAPTTEATYRYTIWRHVPVGYDSLLVPERDVQTPRILLDKPFLEAWAERTPSARMTEPEQSMVYITIQTSYDRGEHWSKGVAVYLRYNPADNRFKVIGIQRET